MDGIKKLAHKLQEHKPEPKPVKRAHTLSIRHPSYMVLFSYCKRKGMNIGDVISDLMEILLKELTANGELTIQDQALADDYDRVRDEREDSKNMKKHTEDDDSAA